MNCPSRTEEPEGTGFNQNPSALSADLTTRNDLNGIANARELRRIPSTATEVAVEPVSDYDVERKKVTEDGRARAAVVSEEKSSGCHVAEESGATMAMQTLGQEGNNGGNSGGKRGSVSQMYQNAKKAIITYGKFVGPGFMVSALIFSQASR